ncbi:hypothetical protein RFI_18055 [Reticulomyxa filosa]|uniref:Uncharacterized protein n=1 Tax=Reticulomyxa filosa TaxID=46433 RepID=X6MZB6_RETFI|nr:hypothetical protein RFI_18055 [Reticulomyxa filosa]|eukprot:ETO19176.1 hypothetical protein RFI_18055 [Reticulomyxa filosa]
MDHKITCSYHQPLNEGYTHPKTLYKFTKKLVFVHSVFKYMIERANSFTQFVVFCHLFNFLSQIIAMIEIFDLKRQNKQQKQKDQKERRKINFMKKKNKQIKKHTRNKPNIKFFSLHWKVAQQKKKRQVNKRTQRKKSNCKPALPKREESRKKKVDRTWVVKGKERRYKQKETCKQKGLKGLIFFFFEQ